LADDGGYLLPDPKEGLIVFWWVGRPVAHRWVIGGAHEPLSGQIDSQVLARIAAEERRAAFAQLDASVVICTRDRPDKLQRSLASLPQQTWQAREVIVVDNASTDSRTRDVAHAAGAIYVREDRGGLDFARNTGAREATSPIVAYTDDDVLLHPQWLERLVAAFDAQAVAAVTGLVLPAELATEAQWHFEAHWSFGRGYLRQDFDTARFAKHRYGVFPAWEIGAGASMAFRREIFSYIGYFDERLDVGQAGCSGDSEFWYRIMANGFTCRYEPRSVAFHFHRSTLQSLASQIYYYMRGHAVALFVQWERTGIATNLSRALLRLPGWYAARIMHCLRGVRLPQDRFLREEVLGYLSGIVFYLRHRREGP
jgi:GT2 family glycosyltransferase